MRRKGYRRAAVMLSWALVCASVSPVMGETGAAASKAPALSVEGKTMEVGKRFTLSVKNIAKKNIVKTTWSVNDAGSDYITLTNKKKKKVTVTAVSSPGTAKITAKIKYKKNKKTVTKKLKCKVKVKAPESVVTATPMPMPTMPDTTIPPYTEPPVTSFPPTGLSGVVNFNAVSNTFEVSFSQSLQSTYTADAIDASGAKNWTTNASRIAKVYWHGSPNYLLPVTRVVLAPDGMKMTVYSEPGPIRMGAYFDVVLSGLYGIGETPNYNSKIFSMAAPVSSLQAVVDNNLTQPLIGSNRTTCISVTFNQPMKSSYYLDKSASMPGTLELGGWQANANQLARVYEMSGGRTSASTTPVAGVTAYAPSGGSGIERIVIDLGTNITASKEYMIQLTGFTPDKSSGILSSDVLTTTIKFTPESLRVNSAVYQILDKTTVMNDESTDVVLRVNIANGQGNGTLMKKSYTRAQGWPSDYVSVKDVSNNGLSVSYIKSTPGSNEVEIGVQGGRNSDKFTVQFESTFPYAFLSLISNQLVNCDSAVVIDVAGTSTSGGTGGGDVGTFKPELNCFEIKLQKAYTHTVSPDEGKEGAVRTWKEDRAKTMMTIYDATSTGSYDSKYPSSVVPNKIVLSADGLTLQVYVDPNSLQLSKRYCLVPIGFIDPTTKTPITGASFAVTVNKLNSVAIQRISAYPETEEFCTVFRVDLSGGFSVNVDYDETGDTKYKGVWRSSADSVAEVDVYDNAKWDDVNIKSVAALASGNTLEITADEPLTEGYYQITLKGIQVVTTTPAVTMTGNYKLEHESMKIGHTDVKIKTVGTAADSEIVITMSQITPAVKTTTSTTDLLTYATDNIGLTRDSSVLSIQSVSVTSSSITITAIGDVDVGQAVRITMSQKTPYLFCSTTAGRVYTCPASIDSAAHL